VKYLKNTNMSNVGINKDQTPQEGDGGIKEEEVYMLQEKRPGQRL
jgi:hypothetical protein